MDKDAYLTIREAADTAGVHPTTIRNWIRWGWMPNTFRKGRIVLVSSEDIQTQQDKRRTA